MAFNKFDLHIMEHPDAPGAENFLSAARAKAEEEIALLRQCLEYLDPEDDEYGPIRRDLERLEMAPGWVPDGEQYDSPPEWKSDDYRVRQTTTCPDCEEVLQADYDNTLATCECGTKECYL